MEKVAIWFFIVGAILVCRALSFAVIQWEMFTLRDSTCIKRIVREQKVCDVLIGIYHTLVVLFGINLIMIGGWGVFHTTTLPVELGVACPLILLILFVGYYLLKCYLFYGYDLKDYYTDMVKYRRAQEVVTKDNDHEVSFLQAYRRIEKHQWYAGFWMLLILGVLLYCRFVLCVIV